MTEEFLSKPAEDLQNQEGVDHFSVYRKAYLSFVRSYCPSLLHKNATNLDTLKYDHFLNFVSERLNILLKKYNFKNIIYGISGDLDSSLVLIALSQVVKEKCLDCRIIAYHFKNDFQPKRASRIKKLLNYVNNTFSKVDFYSYDISVSSQILSAEMDIFEHNEIKPKTHAKSLVFNDILESSKVSLGDFKNSFFPIKKREKAPLMHEISIAIRGRLLRRFSNSILVGSVNATEVCFSNFTTTDVLMNFDPLIFVNKTSIASMFEEVIEKSNNFLKFKDWEFSISTPTPFYPSTLNYRLKSTHVFSFNRKPTIFNFLDTIDINTEESILSKQIEDFFLKNIENSSVPGQIQYPYDLYINYFLIQGFSLKEVDFLMKKFPLYKSDVLLASFIYLCARELKLKDEYMAKMLI